MTAVKDEAMSAELKEASLYSHLEALRRLLLVSLLAVVVGSIISYAFLLDYIMNLFMAPMKNVGQKLVFLAVGEGFITQLKLAVFGGIVIASPVFLWQAISFVAPALYAHEKRVLFSTLLFATLLFLSGIVFSYTCLLVPGLTLFLVNFSAGLTPMVSVSSYVSFVCWFLLPFGFVFEIPVIVFCLSLLGLITPEFLIRKRKYLIFIMFIIAAILTPPDVITQVFLALPMILLYEIGIWIAKLTLWLKSKKDEPQA